MFRTVYQRTLDALLSTRNARALITSGVVAASVVAFGLVPACGSSDAASPTGSSSSGTPGDGQVCVELARGSSGGVADAPIRSDDPDANFGASDTAAIGFTGSGDELDALLRYDLSPIPINATIDSADLSIYVTDATDAATLYVHRVTKAWVESSVTYTSLGDSFDSAAATSFANGGAGTGGPLTVDLVGLVSKWHSGAEHNEGLLLKMRDGDPAATTTISTSESAAIEQRPALTVCYTPTEPGPNCFDGIKNQGEDEVDCGGPCAPCDACSGVTCDAADECHAAGSCDPSTGECTSETLPDGTLCDDGDPCSQTDTCVAGVCTGANPVNCAGDACHLNATCDPATGLCTGAPVVDGTVCDDGDSCTLGDTCEVGVCTGTTSPTTGLSGASVTPGPGDPDGSAVASLVLDDASATVCFQITWNGIATPTAIDIRQGTVGQPGPVFVALSPSSVGCAVGVSSAEIKELRQNPSGYYIRIDTAEFPQGALRGQLDRFVVCSALDECHDVGVCNQGTGLCSNPLQPNGVACNDGNACTQTDTCQNGLCAGTNPVVCSASDQCHTLGICDAKTGVCSNPAAPTGTLCDDADLCTQVDTCVAGVCTGTSPVLGACNTGLIGACAAGTLTCANNATTCVPDFTPMPETCDGIDNDCDGLVDESTDPTDANTCASAMTQMVPAGGFVDVFGTVDADGDDYYVFDFGAAPPPGSFYHPKIDLVDSAGGLYTMLIEETCGSGILCNQPLSTFEMLYPNDPGGCLAYGTCTDNVPKKTSWVARVLPVGAGPVCALYQVRASNQ